ncbi:restriction endonuclease subunit S [uncultured Anaerovibrio sp.]|uniref:restriction endonuclease subunit S n=1 Tax=uncultured Anaerovibrio sp. TaxID=361586 RepID=UPI0025DF8EB9|nr:restriction endonuclease subunit S [uncultured Anaerovibrio sp.]
MSKKQLTIVEKMNNALVPEGAWPYRLPDNWCWVRFDITYQNVSSSKKKIKQKEYNEVGKYPIVDQGEDLVGGYSDDKTFVYNGKLPAIVFGDHTRRIKYIDFRFIQGADGVKVLCPINCFLPKFYYYGLYNMAIPDLGYRRHFPIIRKMNFVLPPLSEQQRIVSRIESLFAKLDEAKEKIQNVLDGAENRKAAILHQAFTGQLTAQWRKENGVADDSWEDRGFDDCINKMQNGLSKRRGEKGEKYIVLRLADVGTEHIITSDLRLIVLDDVEQVKYTLQDGDVLMIRVNGSRDNVGRQIYVSMPDKWAYCDHLIRIKYKENVSAKFMCLFARTNFYRHYIEENMVSSAGQNTISRKGMQKLLIKMPTLPEQKEIVRLLDKFLDKEKSICESCEASLATIETIKKSILAKAFRGELGTNNPAEESAKELLKKCLTTVV